MKMRKSILILWVLVSIGIVINGCGTIVPIPASPIHLEAEAGTGEGEIKLRDKASNEKTMWLKTDETLTIQFNLATSARYRLDVVTSNDHVNDVPLETVYVLLDDEEIGHFFPVDTGDGGLGWNVFTINDSIGPVEILAGDHSLAFYVTEGDGFGVEIDVVILTHTE